MKKKKQAAASRILQLPGDHMAWRTIDGYMPQKILSQRVVVKGYFSMQLFHIIQKMSKVVYLKGKQQDKLLIRYILQTEREKSY